MFLWVRLVLDSLEFTYSPEDLRTIVHNLPEDLNELYSRILTQLCSVRGPHSYGGVPRMISWLCFTQRPLQKHELLHGLAESLDAASGHVKSIPVAQILDHCKPFIEERSDSTVILVHFSVKEQVYPFPLHKSLLTYY
jgi:hypothetical protein